MRKIKLQGLYGKGHVALVDDSDYEKLVKYKWLLQIDRKTPHLKYVYRCEKGKKYFLHREILGDKPGHVVDHVNRNTLDNTRNNLRHLNHRESVLNRENFFPEPKGYTKIKWGWQSQYQKSGKNYYLGTYKTPEDARDAYLSFKKYMEEPNER